MANKIYWEVIAWGKDTKDPVIRCKNKAEAYRLADKLNKDPNYQGEHLGAYVICRDDDGIID